MVEYASMLWKIQCYASSASGINYEYVLYTIRCVKMSTVYLNYISHNILALLIYRFY